MLRSFEFILGSAQHAAEAANRTLEDLRSGKIEQEPPFTDRMIARIEESMNGYKTDGIVWGAETGGAVWDGKTLTDRGSGAQEKKYGADFMGVLRIAVKGFTVAKGLLAQAKRIEPGARMDNYEEMRNQCAKMLERTAESFLFLYSTDSISVVPATSVYAADSCNPHELYSLDIMPFFMAHFASFVGDIHLFAPKIGVIRDLPVRRWLVLTAKSTTAKADPEKRKKARSAKGLTRSFGAAF